MKQKDSQILLVVGVNSFFYHQFSLALLLRKHSMHPILMFDVNYPTIHYDIELCVKHSMPYLLVYPETKEPYSGVLSKPLKSVGEILRKIEYRLFSRFFREVLRSFGVLRKIKYILRREKIRIVVMVTDLVQYDTGIYIKAAHEEKAQVMIIPLFAANYKEAAQHYYNDVSARISEAQFRKLSRNERLSKWVIDFRGKYIIRLPLSFIYAKEFLGIAPSNPWSINSGNFDTMAVEGPAVKQLFISNGNHLDPNRIIVTGSLSTDKVYANLLDKPDRIKSFCKEYGLDPGKKHLLVAIPPDMFAARQIDTEFETYDEFVRFWVSSITTLSENYNILYTIHPSVDKKDHTYFTDLGCKIISGPTIDLISLFDLYIACISATIQWAILSGIPVINHDIYNYDYDDYKGSRGVRYAATKKEFVQLLEEVKDTTSLAVLAAIQQKDAGEWGVLDGNGGERIISHIKKVIVDT